MIKFIKDYFNGNREIYKDVGMTHKSFGFVNEPVISLVKCIIRYHDKFKLEQVQREYKFSSYDHKVDYDCTLLDEISGREFKYFISISIMYNHISNSGSKDFNFQEVCLIHKTVENIALRATKKKDDEVKRIREEGEAKARSILARELTPIYKEALKL